MLLTRSSGWDERCLIDVVANSVPGLDGADRGFIE